MNAQATLFSNITKSKRLPLYDSSGTTEPKRVAQFLSFSNADVAKISATAVSSVRFEANRVPEKIRSRMMEIANICELVAEHFDGDAERTVMWFREKNPMLGGLSPRDMLRFGRYQKLLQIIMDFKSGNIA